MMASIYDEGVLSEGFLSGRSLCLDGVMYGGGFVRGGFVRRGFCPTFAVKHLFGNYQIYDCHILVIISHLEVVMHLAGCTLCFSF